MKQIENLDDFNDITSNITSFSHAYLFEVNSLVSAFPYIKEFAKRIICNNEYHRDCQLDCDICYQIDHDEYDDLYIVNPSTININTSEINKLLEYMKTKSLRKNGKRVYIIYGFERLTRDVSNKILKFLEEPEENIYALLMTEKIDRILNTIISRCQKISLHFFTVENNDNMTIDMTQFLNYLYKNRYKTIAGVSKFWSNYMADRQLVYDCYNQLETIISKNISDIYSQNQDKKYQLDFIDKIDIGVLISIMQITMRLKALILQNINLNLILDRYIIEVTRELK